MRSDRGCPRHRRLTPAGISEHSEIIGSFHATRHDTRVRHLRTETRRVTACAWANYGAPALGSSAYFLRRTADSPVERRADILRVVSAATIDCALTGAVLMDLAFGNRSDTSLETLFVIDRSPMGNPLLAPVLAKIAAQEETSDARAWLRTLAAEDASRIRDQALVLVLVLPRGILERREGSVTRVFLCRSDMLAHWPKGIARRPGFEGRRQAGHRIGKRIHEVLPSDGILDPRDAALLGLVDAGDLLGEMAPGKDIDRLCPRVARLRQLDLIGRKLARGRGNRARLCAGHRRGPAQFRTGLRRMRRGPGAAIPMKGAEQESCQFRNRFWRPAMARRTARVALCRTAFDRVVAVQAKLFRSHREQTPCHE